LHDACDPRDGASTSGFQIISITFYKARNQHKQQPIDPPPPNLIIFIAKWPANLVDVLPLLLPGRWEHHPDPPQLLSDHPHPLSLALPPQLLCHQRLSKHQLHNSRRAQECLDRLLPLLRKFPCPVNKKKVAKTYARSSLSRITQLTSPKRRSSRIHHRPRSRRLVRWLLLRSSRRPNCRCRPSKPGHNGLQPNKLQLQHSRRRMRRSNPTVQNMHGSEPGKHEHLRLVLGSVEGLSAGRFSILGFAGRRGDCRYLD
jgi:hypothetical protein